MKDLLVIHAVHMITDPDVNTGPDDRVEQLTLFFDPEQRYDQCDPEGTPLKEPSHELKFENDIRMIRIVPADDDDDSGWQPVDVFPGWDEEVGMFTFCTDNLDLAVMAAKALKAGFNLGVNHMAIDTMKSIERKCAKMVG